eukprot:g20727.t1
MAEEVIFKGAPVIIKGLQKEESVRYNGQKGTVTAGPFDNGRYEVTLQGGGYKEDKVLALKPSNFQLDLDALQDGKGSGYVLSCDLLQEMLALREKSNGCEVVVVNACHSRSVGELLADSVPHVVCCNDRVLDTWVDLFMRSFYTALFGGSTVASAFSTASLQLQCQPGIPPEAAQCFCLLPEANAHDEVMFARRPAVRKSLRTE